MGRPQRETIIIPPWLEEMIDHLSHDDKLRVIYFGGEVRDGKAWPRPGEPETPPDNVG